MPLKLPYHQSIVARFAVLVLVHWTWTCSTLSLHPFVKADNAFDVDAGDGNGNVNTRSSINKFSMNTSSSIGMKSSLTIHQMKLSKLQAKAEAKAKGEVHHSNTHDNDNEHYNYNDNENGNGNGNGNGNNKLEGGLPVLVEDVEELYFEQRLDHFTSHPTKSQKDNFTFSQRYFYSSRFVHHGDKSNDNGNGNGSEHHNLRSKKESVKATAASKTTTTTVAFLCVGGEGPSLSSNVLLDSVHCTGDMIELASKLYNRDNVNVHLFALEHRYYGKSYPKFDNDESHSHSHSLSPLSNENLIYLSSRQALADIANFVQFAKSTYLNNVDNNNNNNDIKWVTFGGSYPGMLAAWSRLKYPHLIHAAVSNSAPVEVVLNFPQYNNVVAESLRNEMVGGSELCLEVVTSGHDEIISLLTANEDGNGEGNGEGNAPARERIAQLFNICGGADSLLVERNLHAFLGDGVVYIPVQENDPSCDGELCNIEKICNYLTSPSTSSSSESTPMEKLAQMSNKLSDGSCTDISWENMISFVSSDAAKKGGTRSWLWQTCTEMGFYQTCERESESKYKCPYGKGYHTVDQDLEICERAFGIDAELVPINVEDTLTYYGGWDMAGSRILSVNGDIDPWSSLSMNKKQDGSGAGSDLDLDSNTAAADSSNDMPTYWSRGASHHFWTHKVKESDGDEIQATRKMIHDWVTNVLFDHSDEEDDGSKKVANINVGNFDLEASISFKSTE